MESWINSRSLMIGNVSTEESRKEIRKSPGAPTPLANATTFCFHPLRLDGTHHSSHQFIFSHRRAALPWSAPSPRLERSQRLLKPRGRLQTNRAATIVRRRHDRNDS